MIRINLIEENIGSKVIALKPRKITKSGEEYSLPEQENNLYYLDDYRKKPSRQDNERYSMDRVFYMPEI